MKRITAIIPARGGSKGVPGKNIKQLGGHALIAYSIMAAKQSQLIDRVIVSTDSEEIRQVCLSYGAEVPFLRPAEFARDASPDREFVIHALEWMRDKEGTMPELLVHLRPTTPLRDAYLVDQAIQIFIDSPDATSMRSAHEAPESPYKWFVKSDANLFSPMNEEYCNLPRQQCPPVYIPDGYVDILKTSYVMANADLYGPRMLGYVSPRVLEVDTLEDFRALEYQIASAGHPLLTFLQQYAASRN